MIFDWGIYHEVSFHFCRRTNPALFADFHRYQVVRAVWRKENDQWVVHSAPRIIENWGEKQHEFVCRCLNITLSEGGAVYGAFAGEKLKGVVAVNAEPFGSQGQYREIPFLHISQEYRGQGIGRRLFEMAKAFAKEIGAQKLYISSQASIETQAFYRKMGCRDASEPSAEHIRQNPDERQLECDVL